MNAENFLEQLKTQRLHQALLHSGEGERTIQNDSE